MVSVVISAYKNDRFLIEAINSVVKSAKNNNYEILLGVDNCQVTMSGLIKNKNLLPNTLKIYYFPKVGTYVIRNTLANIAKHENLIFFDSDDIMNDVTFDETIKALRNNDVAKFKYALFYNNFDWNRVNTYQKSNGYHYGCFAIRKKSFLDLNGFEPWVCAADGEFKWRTESNGYKIFGVEKLGFYYRRHNTNLTVQGNTGMKSPIRKYYHKIRDEKAKNNQNQKLEKLNIVDCMSVDIKNIENFQKSLQDQKFFNPYSPPTDSEITNQNFDISKQQKTKMIQKVFESTQKNLSVINYEQINRNNPNHVKRQTMTETKPNNLREKNLSSWKDRFSNVRKSL